MRQLFLSVPVDASWFFNTAALEFCLLVFVLFCLVVLGFELFTLARQVLYCLSHTSSPFPSGYCGDGVLLFAQADLDNDLPF
jgi:hypothetical protein